MDVNHLRIYRITIVCATVNNVTGRRPQIYGVPYSYNFWGSWDRRGKSKCIQVKDKAVPLQAWCDPEGSRKLMFPDFLTMGQDGGRVVSFTYRPHLPPGITPDTDFY
jgi:hypothetical protein